MSTSALPREATLLFASGLPGFESCRRFLLVRSEQSDPGMYLTGLDAPAPTFFTVDPRKLVPDYTCELSPADRARLGAADDTICVCLVIVSCGDDQPRVNMRAPIVINPATMRGIQVVPSDSVWPVDMPWVELACSS